MSSRGVRHLSFTQAALGAELKTSTLWGDESLEIPAGTQPEAVFRLRGKGVPYVDDGEDARGERDIVSAQAVRIAGTIPALMMIKRDHEAFLEKLDILKKVMRQLWVLAHAAPFVFGKAIGFVQDRIRNPHFADVMQERASPEINEINTAEAH